MTHPRGCPWNLLDITRAAFKGVIIPITSVLLSYTFKLYATRPHERPVAGILGFLFPSGDGTTWRQHQLRFQRLASFQDRQDSFRTAPQSLPMLPSVGRHSPFLVILAQYTQTSSILHCFARKIDTEAPNQDKLLVSLATSPLNLFVGLGPLAWLHRL